MRTDAPKAKIALSQVSVSVFLLSPFLLETQFPVVIIFTFVLEASSALARGFT